ncbi:MAG: serine/threonine-protein kinase [Nannocystaceae bacterium]
MTDRATIDGATLDDGAPAGEDPDPRVAGGPGVTTDEGAPCKDASEPPPTRRSIGRYRIIEPLGAGGMGVVYRASDPDLSRDVAIKLLHSEATRSDAARERLRQEARALAELSHPNVVQIYDVGIDGESVYIAMELVPGVDLQRWLEQRRPWREVLALLVETGEGLVAAHHAGLVHRDFKPSNVLVGDDGRPRVVDFGLARATDGGGTFEQSGSTGSHDRSDREPSTLTRPGVTMGTPAYMAPEQHLLRQANAASDQYAFCVSTWEAIFGERPFRGASLQELVTAKERGQPNAPAGTEVPRAVTEALRRGMHPDRARRWPSMDALLEALRARSTPVRTSRWVGGTALLLAGGVVAATWAAAGTSPDERIDCPPAAERLAGAWDDDRARALRATVEGSELTYAEQTWSRLQTRLSDRAQRWQDAYAQTCEARRQPGVDDMRLDRSMVCLSERRDELAALVDVLVSNEGDAVRNAVEAVSQLRPISDCANPDEPPPLDETRRLAAERIGRDLLRAESLLKVASYERARMLAEPAQAEAEALELPTLQARALLTLGRIHAANGEPEAAQQQLSEAALLATSLGRDELAARAAIDLVNIQGAWRSRYQDALEWNRHADSAIERMGGSAELSVLRLNALGGLELSLGHSEQALAALERSLGLVQETFGPGHPLLAATESNLGEALVRAGRFDEGLVTAQRALAAGEQAFGDEHPAVGSMHSRLAHALVRQGASPRAAEHAQRAIDIMTATLGPTHDRVAAATLVLAHTEQRRGRVDEAAAIYERVLPLVEDTHNEVIVLASLFYIERERGDSATALRYAVRSRLRREQLYGADDTRTAIGLALEGEALARVGRDEEAFAAFARAREIDAAHPLGDLFRVTLDAYEGRAHLLAGRPALALEGLLAAVAAQQRLGVEAVDRADVRITLVEALWALSRRDEAAAQLQTLQQEVAPLGPEQGRLRARVDELAARVD